MQDGRQIEDRGVDMTIARRIGPLLISLSLALSMLTPRAFPARP